MYAKGSAWVACTKNTAVVGAAGSNVHPSSHGSTVGVPVLELPPSVSPLPLVLESVVIVVGAIVNEEALVSGVPAVNMGRPVLPPLVVPSSLVVGSEVLESPSVAPAEEPSA